MKKAIKRITLAVLLLLLAAGLAVCAVWGVKGYRIYRAALAECPVAEKVAQIEGQPHYTSLAELPDLYSDAVLGAEDHRFYRHNGVDPIGLLRAVLRNVATLSLKEGGSTITQQLAKNVYFTQTRSAERKIAEIFMAWELERELDKDKILELYINSIYYGGGYYCVYDAAMGYFDKTPAAMTEGECVLLAGIPNAPSIYSPYADNHTLTLKRRDVVLEKMVKHGYLSREEAEQIREEKVL